MSRLSYYHSKDNGLDDDTSCFINNYTCFDMKNFGCGDMPPGHVFWYFDANQGCVAVQPKRNPHTGLMNNCVPAGIPLSHQYGLGAKGALKCCHANGDCNSAPESSLKCTRRVHSDGVGFTITCRQ